MITQNKINPFKFLLLPFAILFEIITSIRNGLYNQGRIYSRNYKYPVIAVGNLSVGGTGKTPMVQWLVQLLKENNNPAMVSRGYGRSTKGFRLAHTGDTASKIGDEAMQLFRHFKGTVPMLVAEKRSDALDTINDFGNKVAVLDDAFQHRSVTASLYILLTDYSRLFTSDFLMPVGLLREKRIGAKRADVIIVTKCPDIVPELEWEEIQRKIRQYSSPNALIVASKITYLDPFSLNQEVSLSKGQKVFLVSGLANPTSLINEANKQFTVVGQKHYPDHYTYKRTDVDYMLENAGDAVILCTEKDFMKLSSYPQLHDKLFAWPIGIQYLNGEEELKSLIFTSIEEKRKANPPKKKLDRKQ